MMISNGKPRNVAEYEKNLVAALLFKPDRLNHIQLSAYDFSESDEDTGTISGFGRLFSVIRSIWEDGVNPNDQVVIYERLLKVLNECGIGEQSFYDEIGGPQTLIELHETSNRINVDNIDLYVREIKRNASFQKRQKLANQIINSDSLEQQNQFIEQINEVSTSKPKRFKILSSDELANADLRVEWHIDQVLIKGQPVLCGGLSKTLKTSNMVDMGISIASGTPFLDHFSSNKANVLFVSGESGLQTLREKANVICQDREFELADLKDSLIWSDTIPTISNPDDQFELRAVFEDKGIEVVVIDPLYLSLGGSDDLNNVFSQGERLRDFSEICQRAGVTLILCHHAKKTIAHSDPLQLNDLAGAGFQEFARQWFLINRREPFENGVHRLWLTFGGSYGHGRIIGVDVDEGTFIPNENWRKWETEILNFDDVSQQARDRTKAKKQQAKDSLNSDVKSRIERAFIAIPNNQGSKKDIAAAAGCGHGGKAFNEMLGELIRERKVQPIEYKSPNGRTYEHFKFNFEGVSNVE